MADRTSYIPDFIVIGAMKAGTSTLFRDFFVNPAIERTRGKEVNFLLKDSSFENINQLYKNQYTNYDLLKCDVSPKYSQFHNYPGVPERIFGLNPKAKIIYITRDPIERIISHLHHNLLRDRFPAGDVKAEALKNKDYTLCSNYQFQINKFLEYFPKEQILVLMLEEIKSDPNTFCRRLNTFLGIDSISHTGKRFNVSENRYKIIGHDAVHRRVKNGTLIRLYHAFWYLIHLNVSKPQLTEDTIEILRQSLDEPTQAFADAFQLDISHWKNFSK